MVKPEDFADIATSTESLHQGVIVERIEFWRFGAGFWRWIRFDFGEFSRKLRDLVEELVVGDIYVGFRQWEPLIG